MALEGSYLLQKNIFLYAADDDDDDDKGYSCDDKECVHVCVCVQ